MLLQLEQWLQAEFGEYPRIVEAITDRTVPSMVESNVRRTVAFIVAQLVGAHVERLLTDVGTGPDQSAIEVALVDLIESVLERGLRTLPVSGAVLADPDARPAARPAHVSPAGMECALQGQVDESSHEEGKSTYLPPTLGSASSSHVETDFRDCHGKYSRRENAGRKRDGQKVCDKREMIPLKPIRVLMRTVSRTTTNVAKRRLRRKGKT